jgi:hypothetical protein
LEEQIADKDRVEGSAKEIKGKTKEGAGKVRGDAKLESEGKADEAARNPMLRTVANMCRKQCEQLAKNRD